MKKFLILGSHSFSGSTFIDFLLKKNYYVYGTYNTKKHKKNLIFLNNKNIKKFKNFKINFLIKKDNEKLKKIIKKFKPNYIIDFASICDVNKSWSKPSDYFEINVSSKISLINFILNNRYIKKYIYISTPEIFGNCKNFIPENYYKFNPSTPYATSKLAAESIIKNYINFKKFPGILTRFSNFYGPGQLSNRLIPKLVISAKLKKKFPLQGDGSSLRSFIYSEDFCRGIYQVIKYGKIGQIYHFSNLKFYRILDVVKKVLKNFDLDFKKNVRFDKERIGKDHIYKLKCEITKKKLKWSPKIDLDEGIKRVTDYEIKKVL